MYLVKLTQLVFNTYILLILARIILSWFPSFSQYRIVQGIGRVTEPYLGFFRRIIPPIGGMFDISPLLGLFLLQIAEKLIVGWLL